ADTGELGVAEVQPEAVFDELGPEPSAADVPSSAHSDKVSLDFWSSSPDHPSNIDSLAGDETYESEVDAAEEQQLLWQLKNEETVYGLQSQGLLEIVRNLADLYNRQRRYAEAEPLYQRLSELTIKWKGPKSADMHNVWLSLGDVCVELQKHDQA